jgi:hypothetical protein
MNVLQLALALLCAYVAQRQARKAYRAAMSVVRPLRPRSRPIGPERERIPEWN